MGFRDRLRAAVRGEDVEVAVQPSSPTAAEEPTRERGKGPDIAAARLDWHGEHLFGKNWSGANLRRVNLDGADLSGANLANADLGFAKLTNAKLRGANLAGASLRDAELWGADLAGADLTNTDLTDTRFSAVFDRGGEAYAVNLDQVVSWSGARRGGKVGEEARQDVERELGSSRTFRASEAENRARAELGEDPD